MLSTYRLTTLGIYLSQSLLTYKVEGGNPHLRVRHYLELFITLTVTKISSPIGNTREFTLYKADLVEHRVPVRQTLSKLSHKGAAHLTL